MKMLTLVMSLLLTAGAFADVNNHPRPEIVRGSSNEFAVDLYAKVEGAEENLFFSPYSLSSALAMVYAGARGETAEEMARTLNFPYRGDIIHASFGIVERSMSEAAAKGDFQLSIANALWGQQGFGFREEFLALTQKHYGAGLSEVDFIKATEAARGTINTWVADHTQQKILDLMPEGSITALTRLVLTNAIYFKGNWVNQFDPKLTREEIFQVAGAVLGELPTVPMMHQTKHFGYMEDERLQAVVLPYKGRRLEMVILLPKKVDGLPAVEAGLSEESLNARFKQFRSQEVVLSLPRFTTRSKFSLKETLSDMGMRLAFTDAADFSGMTTAEKLSISAVIHEAFVDVNETGTEAAAATGISMGLTSVEPAPPVVFKADHPFIYLIRDRETGVILFFGRFARP